MTARYKASDYFVIKSIGTTPRKVEMEVRFADMKTWLDQVGRCFELASLSYARESEMMTATFRPGNGLALIAEVRP